MMHQPFAVKDYHAKKIVSWLKRVPFEKWPFVASDIKRLKQQGAVEVINWMIVQPDCERAIACDILWANVSEFDKIHRLITARENTSWGLHRLLIQIVNRGHEDGFPAANFGWLNDDFKDQDIDHRPGELSSLRWYKKKLQNKPNNTLILANCLTKPVRPSKSARVLASSETWLSDEDKKFLAPHMLALGAYDSRYLDFISASRRFLYKFGLRSHSEQRSAACMAALPFACVGIAILRDIYLGQF